MRSSIRSLALLTALFALPSFAQVDVNVGGTKVKVDDKATSVDVGGAPADKPGAAPATPATPATPAAKKKEKVAKIEGVGVQQELVCEKDGLQRIEVSGTTARLTIKGACKELSVTGASNEIALEFIQKIEVTGASNVVRYLGADAKKKNKKTQLKVTGLDNKVEQVKPAAG